MAIDPNISLGVKAPEGLDVAKYAQLANTLTQNQVLQAQIPGIQAESEIKKRAADFNSWLTSNRQKLVNPDGSPNIDSIVNHASEAGYFNEAQATAAHNFATQAASIKNSTDIQDRNLKTAKFTQDLLANTATLLHAAPEDKRPVLLQQYAQYADKLIPGSGQQITQVFGKPDDKTGVLGVDSKAISAVKQATVTALQEQQLALQTGQLGVSQGQLGISQQDLALRQAAQSKQFAAEGFTPEGKDPESEVNKMFRDTMRRSGVPVDDNMTIWRAQQIAGTRETATTAQGAQIMPTGTRAGALANQAELTATHQNYKAAIDAASVVKKDILGTKLGTIGSSAWQKYIAQNKELAGLETAIRVHNDDPVFKNDPIDPSKMTVAQIISKLKAADTQILNRAAGQAAVVGTQQFPSNTKVSAAEQLARDRDRLAILQSELDRPGNSPEDIAAIKREIARVNPKVAEGMPQNKSEKPVETKAKVPVPKPGQIISASDGSKYVFKGGDPKDKNNYTKVK